MSDRKVIKVQELDPAIIPPLTSRFQDPNYNGGSKIVVIGKPGCFKKGTPIMMFDGTIKAVEDVNVNDVVMGDDSSPRQVLELCRNRDMMYAVVPSKGEPYVVNKKHKLVLSDCESAGEIIEVSIDDFLTRSEQWKRTKRVFRTPVTFTNKSLDVDPYVFGLWLTNNEHGEKSSFVGYRVVKHIPLEYKTSSIVQRLHLIAGIVDGNGELDETTNTYTIRIKSELVAKDIVHVVNSVGLFGDIHYCRTNMDEKEYFKVIISGNISIINSQTLRVTKTNKDYLHRKFKIRPLKEDDYYGFTISGNHRFLLGNCEVVRNTGKSTIVKALLYSKRHIFPVGIAMSGSEDTNHTFSEFMPSIFVYNNYDQDKIMDFIKRQKLARKHLPNPWAFIVLDDCTDDPTVFNRPLQNALYKKGRHWNMMYILSLQYSLDVKPQIRTNIDGVFILREPIESNREKLYKNYASIIPSYEIFKEMMDKLTEDYHCIYIHNATDSNNWQDCVFYWKAPVVPRGWKIGAPEYWDFHYQRYNDNYVDPLVNF